MFMTRSLNRQRYAKDNRTAHLIAHSDKSVAYVTNNERLCSTFCTIEANYCQTRSIARPLCDSRATCLCIIILGVHVRWIILSEFRRNIYYRILGPLHGENN